MEKYRGNGRAECVAKCLVNQEGETIRLPRCAARNAERLRDHVSCYAVCKFYDPVVGGFPDYSFEIGGGILWSDYWDEIWR